MSTAKAKSKTLRHFRDLEVYQMAFDSAMKIFKMTRDFPVEERYSITNQIRRSSRSVCSSISEAWRKRKYEAYFRNKLTDAMSEASETQTWFDFCLACEYIDRELYEEMDKTYETIIAKLNAMERRAESFCFQSS
ncbi:MAG: four helix bundle protein [bacterium]